MYALSRGLRTFQLRQTQLGHSDSRSDRRQSKWQVCNHRSADRRFSLLLDCRFFRGVLCIPRARFTLVMNGKWVSPLPRFPTGRCSCFAWFLPRRDVLRLGSTALCPPATLVFFLPKMGNLRRADDVWSLSRSFVWKRFMLMGLWSDGKKVKLTG